MTQDEIIGMFGSRETHVFGALGAEGFEVLRWLKSKGIGKIHAHDTCESRNVKKEWMRVHEIRTEEDERAFDVLISDKDIIWHFDAEYETPIAGDALLVLPQSWFRYERNFFLRRFFDSRHAVLPEFRDRVWTLTRLYFELFRGRIIAVTGSDGKTTTTSMISAIMNKWCEHARCYVFETGNDRRHTQSLARIADASPDDILIIEVSDRQLSFGFELRPHIAVVTNVTANKHMDDYGGLKNYARVKGNLLRYQTTDDTTILNSDDAISKSILANIGFGKRVWFGESERALKVRGHHNKLNAGASALAAIASGVLDEVAHHTLSEFQGVPHRLQLVHTWRGIEFVEDSAGGNPVNIAASIRAFYDRPLVLLSGGYRPNLTVQEIQPIIDALKEKNSVEKLLLFGSNCYAFKELLVNSMPEIASKIVITETLEKSFEYIRREASRFENRNFVVCMTPGWESYDQYRDYRERAAHFIALAHRMGAE